MFVRLRRAVVVMLLTLAAVYVLDFLQWKVRDARGTGSATLTVTRYVVAPLKGGKEEYYPGEAEDVACSRSLFPQTGAGACWWLARHRVVFDR